MSSIKILALILALCASAFASITPNTTGACGGVSGTTFNITLSPSTGSTVIVGIGIRTVTSTVSTITDNGASGGSTYVPYVTRNDGTTERVELWIATSAAASVTTITVTTGASTKMEGCANYYTGVTAIGNAYDGAVPSGNPPTGLVLQDANNYIFCVASSAGSQTTYVASVGTKRATGNGGGGSAATQAAVYIGDNTSASGTASIACTGQPSGSPTSAVAAIELRLNAPGSTFGSLIRNHLSENWAASTGAAETQYRKAVAGNLLIISISALGSGATVNAPTDSNGTISTAVSNVNFNSTGNIGTFYVPNITAGTHQITTALGASAVTDLLISEFTGIRTSSPLDVTSSSSGSGTAATSGSAVTTNANDLIYGVTLLNSAQSSKTFTVGSGFTKLVEAAGVYTNQSTTLYGESKVVSATGSNSAAMTITSTTWGAVMTTWKDPALVTCAGTRAMVGVGC